MNPLEYTKHYSAEGYRFTLTLDADIMIYNRLCRDMPKNYKLEQKTMKLFMFYPAVILTLLVGYNSISVGSADGRVPGHEARATALAERLCLAAVNGDQITLQAALDEGATFTQTAIRTGLSFKLYAAESETAKDWWDQQLRDTLHCAITTSKAPGQGASATNHLACVTALIKAGVDVNLPSVAGADFTKPLYFAVVHRQGAIATELYRAGASLIAVFKDAAKASDCRVIKPLLAYMTPDCDPIWRTTVNECLPLALIKRRHELYASPVETVQELLKHGADPEMRSADGYTPLYLIASGGEWMRVKDAAVKITDLLISSGANVNTPQPGSDTIINRALSGFDSCDHMCQNDKLAVAERLLRAGASVDKLDEQLAAAKAAYVKSEAELRQKDAISTHHYCFSDLPCTYEKKLQIFDQLARIPAARSTRIKGDAGAASILGSGGASGSGTDKR